MLGLLVPLDLHDQLLDVSRRLVLAQLAVALQRGPEDGEALLLLSGVRQDLAMDLVLDILLDTGIYLTVKTFSRSRYEVFRKAELPMIQNMEASRVSLWKAA